MAMALEFECGNCHRSIEAWSDGNPYYIELDGSRRYAYHPNHDLLARCVGHDTPHLCLGCGERFNVDSRAPVESCPRCGAGEIAPEYKLEGQPCPFCRQGHFGEGVPCGIS